MNPWITHPHLQCTYVECCTRSSTTDHLKENPNKYAAIKRSSNFAISVVKIQVQRLYSALMALMSRDGNGSSSNKIFRAVDNSKKKLNPLSFYGRDLILVWNLRKIFALYDPLNSV
ncbi:hypothetical protein NPIL_683881 [Nephila pilipes]|uniref:Uncharacterized protein n=1 Tax=Nephila pilipes TaxID=299642 RepID=A0A8X6N0E4_NEPPI|nr:hypothetical protein NPIL_683881 [Nephila pilipes]